MNEVGLMIYIINAIVVIVNRGAHNIFSFTCMTLLRIVRESSGTTEGVILNINSPYA